MDSCQLILKETKNAMSEAGITKVQLAKRLGVDEKEVRRLPDTDYHSKLPRIAQAIGVLGRHPVSSRARCTIAEVAAVRSGTPGWAACKASTSSCASRTYS